MTSETGKNKDQFHLLIAEDNPTRVQFLFRHLQKAGYKVTIVNNGYSALAFLEKEIPDLILLDVMMPDISGFETCKKIKENDATKDIPVMFITALADLPHKLEGFEAGGVDYITKPFQMREVMARVETHLLLRHYRKQVEQTNTLLEEKVKERTADLESANVQLVNEVERRKEIEAKLREEIGERKKIEEELILAKNKAEESDKLKSQFLMQMSHEIRTPISDIINFSNVIELKNQEFFDEALKESVQAIKAGANRLSRTIEMMLDISQLKAGTVKPNREKINLKEELFNEIAPFFEELSEIKKVDFILEYKIDDAYVLGDLKMIKKIVTQLLENAFQFTSKGAITATLTKEHYVLLTITDTGIGISEDFLPKIYNIFLQEDRGYSRRYEGNGLGLALVKNLCDINNIDIEIRSKKNEGTSVSLLFTGV